jgi:hypothetical protein
MSDTSDVAVGDFGPSSIFASTQPTFVEALLALGITLSCSLFSYQLVEEVHHIASVFLIDVIFVPDVNGSVLKNTVLLKLSSVSRLTFW